MANVPCLFYHSAMLAHRVKPPPRLRSELTRALAAFGMQGRLAMDDGQPTLTERLTIFIDFLGFADATLEGDRDRTTPLLAVLRRIAGLRSDFLVYKTEIHGGGASFDVRPAVTTFSDHIVLSYRLDEEPFDAKGGVDLALSMAQRMVARIAVQGLSLGLPIRGGATIGPLYHADSVVFGPAMIEAYRLEANVSRYPRIAVSRKLYSRLMTQPNEGLLIVDTDGVRHLEYFTHMIWAAGGASGDEFVPRLQAWYEAIMQTIGANVATLEGDERWSELSKWVWLREHLCRAHRAMSPVLFQRNDESPAERDLARQLVS
jgi:hypothetical protein